jgi:hypothetical protein
MSLRYALSAMFCLALLPVASVPVTANANSIEEAAAIADKSMLIELAARKGGGHKGGAHKSAHKGGKVKASKTAKVNRSAKVNKKVQVNRNLKVNKNVNVNVKRGLYTGRHIYTGGVWVRPSAYWWPVGGAVAAGAAMGFVTAATAAAWAGASPGPDYCWYYTDPSQQQGFWDLCP